jgi:hypothetical protein
LFCLRIKLEILKFKGVAKFISKIKDPNILSSLRVLDLEKGKLRLVGLKSIKEDLNFGDNLSVAIYDTQLSLLETKLKTYNQTLSDIDNLYNECIAQIDVIKDYNERMLSGVTLKYGKNSSEYEMAGGTRKSERKKAKPKTKL